MRVLILLSGAALLLAACGRNEAAENVVNVDSDLTAEQIITNDTTAIDAATNDAAAMAEDVALNGDDLNLLTNAGDNAAEELATPSRPQRRSTAPATSNTAENTAE